MANCQDDAMPRTARQVETPGLPSEELLRDARRIIHEPQKGVRSL
jgi:hypothetical protein